jgi:hypothetical protein
MSNAYTVSTELFEGARGLQVWQDDTVTEHGGIGSEAEDWIERLMACLMMGFCEHGNESSGSIKAGNVVT